MASNYNISDTVSSTTQCEGPYKELLRQCISDLDYARSLALDIIEDIQGYPQHTGKKLSHEQVQLVKRFLDTIKHLEKSL